MSLLSGQKMYQCEGVLYFDYIIHYLSFYFPSSSNRFVILYNLCTMSLDKVVTSIERTQIGIMLCFSWGMFDTICALFDCVFTRLYLMADQVSFIPQRRVPQNSLRGSHCFGNAFTCLFRKKINPLRRLPVDQQNVTSHQSLSNYPQILNRCLQPVNSHL